MAGNAAASAAWSPGLSRASSPAIRSARIARPPAEHGPPLGRDPDPTTRRPPDRHAFHQAGVLQPGDELSHGGLGHPFPGRERGEPARPPRSSVASVAAAVSESPLGGLSHRNSPISRSSPAATPAASTRSAWSHEG